MTARIFFGLLVMIRTWLLLLLLGASLTLVACKTGPNSAAAAPRDTWPAPTALPGSAGPTRLPNYVLNGTGNSNAEQAHARLQSQGSAVYLIVVSAQSTGLEGEIYRDLRQRDFRATVGPDEGIDTHAEFCYPACVFVPAEEVNAIGVEAWVQVLQHEYRYITQEKNNPNMARDFRDSNGIFTTYAAFLETCADYGLNVAPIYRAQQRMDQLKNVLGPDQPGTIDQACSGDKSAYQNLVEQYNQKVGEGSAFQGLFPPFK